MAAAVDEVAVLVKTLTERVESSCGPAKRVRWVENAGEETETCFNCKRGGPFLACHACTRSYHRRCLDPPIHRNFIIDQPWFCPNCALLQLDTEELVPQIGSRSVFLRDDLTGRLQSVGNGEVTTLPTYSEIKSSRQVSNVSQTPTARIRTPVPEVQERPHKRSRYTTLPRHVDEALGLLNRELETALQAKGLLEEMASKVQMLEQELQIRKGQEVLTAREQEREWSPGRDMLESLRKQIVELRRENGALRAEVERLLGRRG